MVGILKKKDYNFGRKIKHKILHALEQLLKMNLSCYNL